MAGADGGAFTFSNLPFLGNFTTTYLTGAILERRKEFGITFAGPFVGVSAFSIG